MVWSFIKKLLSKEREVETDSPAEFLLDTADVDYLTARFLLHTGFIYPILFHSHQAGEKYLKALLIQANTSYPNTHSLRKLLSRVRAENILSTEEESEIRNFLVMLDRQYETSRYGGESRYNFFTNIAQLVVRENGVERRARDGEFRVGGIIMLPPNHLRSLDKMVSILRPKITKSHNHLRDVAEGRPNGLLAQGWRMSVNDDDNHRTLAINIASVLRPQNDYLDEIIQ